MDARWIAVLLCLPMVAGCLSVNEIIPDPKEGDLELTISAPTVVFSPGEANVSVTATLQNVCDHDVLIDDSLYFGTTLHPIVHAANGSEVVIHYPLVDRDPHYSSLAPGEALNVTEVLIPRCIVIDGTQREFDWDIKGSYVVTVTWWGSRGSAFNLTSNELTITIGDYLPPEEGDLSLTISMPRTVFLIKPDSMDIAIVLRNVCDHPVLIGDHFSLGYTLFGHAISSNGTRIVFYPGFDPDYEETYSPLYPGRSMVETIDPIGISYVGEQKRECEFYWDVPDTYVLTMYWYGFEGPNTNLSFSSNEISITIMDCPHPQEGNLSLTISMSQYPVSSNDMNLTVEITNVCDHPVLVEDWFYFGCALAGKITLPNGDVIPIHPEGYFDHAVTYTPLLPGESKMNIFDISSLDHVWDDPGIYQISVIYHDEWNNSVPVSSDEITFEIVAST